MQGIEIKSYAKINLDLKILGKLASGYHEINSTFQAISLYDIISISRIKKGFQLTGSIVCPVEENLITKAKRGLEAFIQNSLPCSIDLIKGIPVSAGLGGGSSDAAATLIGLNNLFRLNLKLEELVKIGLEIGSDVPFFLFNKGTARVRGRGGIVKPIERKREISKFYVIARPHKRINTAEMYQLYDKTGKGFFELAKEKYPEVGLLHKYFSSLSSECGMSGTGPSIFAGFNSYEEGAKAAGGLDKEFNFDGDIFITQPISKTYKFIKSK